MDHTQSYRCPSDLTNEYLQIVRENVRRFMQYRNLSQKHIETDLKEQGLLLRQTTLGNFLNANKSLSLGAVVELAKYFGVTVDQLLTPDLDPKTIAAPKADASLPAAPVMGKHFVTDPYAPEFNGFLQTYHVYTLSTRSGEHRVLTGTLTLRPGEDCCEAILTIDSDHNPSNQDTYTGWAFISRTIRTVYIIMFSQKIGEMLTMSMRHHSFYYGDGVLNCRIAGLFSNGVGASDAPTMRRMILSREQLRPEHIPLVLPHIHMNTGGINIPQQALISLCLDHPEYEELSRHLTAFGADAIHSLSEDFVLGACAKIMESTPEQIPIFLSRIRELSIKNRFNKVSRRADHAVRNLLITLGYYTD